MRTRLSIALAAAAEEAAGPKGGSPDLNWIQYVDGITGDYNAELVKGTGFRRRDVDAKNYMQFLQELYGAPDPSVLTNLARTSNFHPDLKRKLWKYQEGDKVLVARSANYELGQRKGSSFEKSSSVGSFGPKVYAVERQEMKNHANLFYCLVYKLVGLDTLMYERDLKPAHFQPPHDEVDAERTTAGERPEREGAEDGDAGGGGGEKTSHRVLRDRR